jgi:hypothetical protein
VVLIPLLRYPEKIHVPSASDGTVIVYVLVIFTRGEPVKITHSILELLGLNIPAFVRPDTFHPSGTFSTIAPPFDVSLNLICNATVKLLP